jgi:hypothetical protein
VFEENRSPQAAWRPTVHRERGRVGHLFKTRAASCADVTEAASYNLSVAEAVGV